MPLLLRAHGYRKTLARLTSTQEQNTSTPRPEQLTEALDIAWIVNGVAARLPHKPTCVPRTLVMARKLGKAGIPFEIVLGAKDPKKENGQLLAHAWIRVGELELNNDPDSGHHSLDHPTH